VRLLDLSYLDEVLDEKEAELLRTGQVAKRRKRENRK